MPDMILHRFLLIPLLLASTSLAFGQTSDEALVKKIVQEVDAKRKEMQVPGLGLAIVKDDKVIFSGGLGYRDLERKIPATGDTLYAIGSSTKAFVGMLTAISADEKRLSFSDHPRKHIPYFRLADPDADAKITVGDLLSHRSGLPRTDLLWAPGNLTTHEILWAIRKAKPTAKLGEKFQYQNIMYAAAGEVLRSANQKSWNQLVEERIFSPLHMARTNTDVKEMIADKDHALGYAWMPASGKHDELPMRDIPSVSAAGAINSSAKEMAQWVRLMLGGGEFEGKRLVSPEGFAELTKPRITVGGTMQYGYGWFLEPWNKQKVVQHGGNIDGFSALVSMIPEKKVGFVLLMNLNGSPLGPSVTDIVYKSLVGVPEEATKSVPLKNPEAEVGTYRLEVAKMDFVVTHEKDKLFVKPSGQPKMEMIPIGERKYKVAPPAPDNVFVTFGPSKDDPKVTEGQLEQSGMKFALVKPKPFASPITVDDLMSKVVSAAGGEAAMRAIRTMSYRYSVDLENQGVMIYGVNHRQSPNHSGDLALFVAAGRKIAESHTGHDGRTAFDDTSFTTLDIKSGVEKEDLAIQSMMFQELDWRTAFPTVTIVGMGKVGEEETYIVEKKPSIGTAVTDYISTRSFLVLRRISGGGPGMSNDTYSDFRVVNGVQVPFKMVRENSFVGKAVMVMDELKVNERIDPVLFKHRPRRPAKVAMR